MKPFAILLSALSLGGTAAHAMPVVATIGFEASDFTEVLVGAGAAAPINPIQGVFRLTFDPMDGTGDIRTDGFVFLSKNFEIDHDIVLSWRFTVSESSETLQIGGVAPGQPFGATSSPDSDFFLGFAAVDGASILSAPAFGGFIYSQSDEPTHIYRADVVSIRVLDVTPADQPAPAVPLPAAIWLLGAGLATFGVFVRRQPDA